MNIKLPPHKCSLTLTHNDHRDVYQSADKWIADNDDHGQFDWENDEAKQRAIATDEIWTMQWYPDSPVGFNAVAAPTLEELLAFAEKDCS